MLIHLVPKILFKYSNKISIESLEISKLNLFLSGDDLVVRKPFPNNQYHVACRGQGKKAIKGILIETDAPFLAPVPNRGKRNEPSYILETLKTVAELKGENIKKMAEITTNNFLKLFTNKTILILSIFKTLIKNKKDLLNLRI